MDTLIFVHARVGIAVVLYMLICTVWGAVAALRGVGASGSYQGALVLAVALALLQGALGIVLTFTGRPPAQWLHVVYGVLVFAALPVAHAYVRGRSARAAAGLYGLAAGIAFAAALRALATG